jgi:hypothetical protein
MPSSTEEAQALGHSEFWDERYAKAEGNKPTHEWFRAFDDLEPFFKKHLFDKTKDEGKDGKILHLGSGDSVGFPITKVKNTNFNTYAMIACSASLYPD